MKIVSVILLAIWALIAVKPCAASLFIMPPAHQVGPRQIVDHRWGWVVRYGPHGSVVQRTTDGGRTWYDRTPPGFTRMAPDLNDTDNFPSSFGLSLLAPRRCWIAYGSRVSKQVIVERTADGGQHWRRETISGGADSVILQFLDTRHAFLLALGGPAAGSMVKVFYSTCDGGKHWLQGGSPDRSGTSRTQYIGSYCPTGMAFRNPREGWITGTDHSDLGVPLVRTLDGGHTWAVQEIMLPDSYGECYANTYQPRFSGKTRRNGAFTADVRGSKIGRRHDSVNFLTHDGGRTWNAPALRNSQQERL